MKIEVTSVSSKGQVVIPNKIRRQIGILEGAKLMIITDGQNLLLKPIQAPKYETFKMLIKESHELARKHGLTKDDVAKVIKKVRNESRR